MGGNGEDSCGNALWHDHLDSAHPIKAWPTTYRGRQKLVSNLRKQMRFIQRRQLLNIVRDVLHEVCPVEDFGEGRTMTSVEACLEIIRRVESAP